MGDLLMRLNGITDSRQNFSFIKFYLPSLYYTRLVERAGEERGGGVV